MTFHDFFHDLLKLSETLGLAGTLKNVWIFLFLGYFCTLNSSTDTNSGVHQNACRSRCSITSPYPTLSLAIYQTKLKFSRTFKDRVLNSLIFHDLYEPWIFFLRKENEQSRAGMIN